MGLISIGLISISVTVTCLCLRNQLTDVVLDTNILACRRASPMIHHRQNKLVMDGKPSNELATEHRLPLPRQCQPVEQQRTHTLASEGARKSSVSSSRNRAFWFSNSRYRPGTSRRLNRQPAQLFVLQSFRPKSL